MSERPARGPGVVVVRDSRNRPLGWALWSPKSEISLRFIERDADTPIDTEWWHRRIEESAGRRVGLETLTNAYRIVHGEADGLPSLRHQVHLDPRLGGVVEGAVPERLGPEVGDPIAYVLIRIDLPRLDFDEQALGAIHLL